MQYLELFTQEYIEKAPITGLIISRDIPYIRKLYEFNTTQIFTYYESRNFAVKNTNILSRVSEHISPHLEYDVYRYLDFIESRLTFLGKQFRFTSDIEKGEIHNGEFFNNDEEIIFSTDDDISIDSLTKNWKRLECLRIYKHPRNDTKLLLPLGREDGSRSGLSVIGVDLRKLAIKYREFVREQKNKDSPLNKNHFVIKYVLSTTIGDIVDHMLLNRIMDLYYGRDIVTPRYKHPFKIFEPEVQINRYVENTLDVITSKNLDFVNILHNIQLVRNIDATMLLLLPDMAGTRQSRWAMFVTRLDHMLFLYEIGKKSNSNRHIINDWKRLAERLHRDSIFENKFTYETEKDVKEKLYQVRNM